MAGFLPSIFLAVQDAVSDFYGRYSSQEDTFNGLLILHGRQACKDKVKAVQNLNENVTEFFTLIDLVDLSKGLDYYTVEL